MHLILSFLICLVSSSFGLNTNEFPESFKFGVSTSAYQIEGAWNEDGKGTSTWDDFVHSDPQVVIDGSNGDIACDSYHHYEDDVKLLKELGAQFYRLSISWPRVLPDGTAARINEKGVEYYRNLLQLLRDNGIEPIVTLYHWDLPSPLQELGGWTNPDIVTYFGEYARVCYKYFGEYVNYWVTINEPQSSCFFGYGGNRNVITLAPGYYLEAEGVYLCAYTHVKAHALAYHIYQNEFKKRQQGKVSLSFVNQWFEPASDSSDDQDAQQLAMQFSLGLFAHPIFVGNWPQLVIERVGNRSLMEGLPQSRLPTFTKDEIEYIKGTYDFYGANYYLTSLVRLAYKENDLPGNASYLVDEGVASFPNSSWKASNASTWLVQVPWGLTKTLKFIHDNYNQPEIIVTENGWSEDGSSLNDTDRIEYVGEHLSSILDAIHDYDVNVVGYTQWSLMDNFEWTNGYSSKFGIVSVDFSDKDRKRTPKQSFYWYKNVISSRCLSAECTNSAGIKMPFNSVFLLIGVLSMKCIVGFLSVV